MTNREAHEQAAGYNLGPLFFKLCGMDPEGEYVPVAGDPEFIGPVELGRCSC